jgi:hypothetical protein
MTAGHSRAPVGSPVFLIVLPLMPAGLGSLLRRSSVSTRWMPEAISGNFV